MAASSSSPAAPVPDSDPVSRSRSPVRSQLPVATPRKRRRIRRDWSFVSAISQFPPQTQDLIEDDGWPDLQEQMIEGADLLGKARALEERPPENETPTRGQKPLAMGARQT